MKKLLLLGLCLSGMSGAPLLAQTMQAPETNYLLKNFHLPKLKCTGALVEADFLQSDMRGVPAPGFSMGINIVLENNWATGLWLDAQSSKRIDIPVNEPVLKPSFSYTVIGWNNELLIMPHRVVNFSIPLRTGVGMASYDDRGQYTWQYSGENWVQVPKNLRRGTYFVAEPGVNVSVNVLKFLSLGAGASYRFSAGNAETGTGEDFSGLNLRAGLRFRITDDGSGKCCCCAEKCN